jgi:ubiquinone/menaquinone biosynthesis C-methylase UbiE
MSRVNSILVLAVLTLAGVPHFAQDRSHADHSFADVEHYAARFESPERAAWQKPDEVVAALGVKPGMTMADIGAGTGYFARRFAQAIGPTGSVFAVDLEPNMLVYMRHRAEQDGQANLIPVLASQDDPRLPDGATELIFVCDTWHHISDRVNYARRLQQDLSPGGRVVIVDFLPGELPVGPPPEAKLSAEQVKAEFAQAGYQLAASLDFLDYQYVLIFKVVSQ